MTAIRRHATIAPSLRETHDPERGDDVLGPCEVGFHPSMALLQRRVLLLQRGDESTEALYFGFRVLDAFEVAFAEGSLAVKRQLGAWFLVGFGRAYAARFWALRFSRFGIACSTSMEGDYWVEVEREGEGSGGLLRESGVGQLPAWPASKYPSMLKSRQSRPVR